MPTGRLFLKPQGKEIAGKPARLAEMVKISSKYIATDLVYFRLKRKGEGAVGPKMKSTSAKALSKSSLMSRLTFCAFK